jgi:hypothetical protein
MRHRRAPRPHPAELDPTSPHPGLPPGTVMLVCRRTGDPLGDVLEAANADAWWPDGRRYDIGLTDSACREEHVHELPSQDEIAVSMAEAKQFRTVIEHRVNVKR